MYALDTHVISYYAGDDAAVVSFIDSIAKTRQVIAVPSIVVAELWSAPSIASPELQHVDTFLNTVVSIPLDKELGRSAGILRWQYRLSLGDSIIAATAILHRAVLLTRNIKDFRRVQGLLFEAI